MSGNENSRNKGKLEEVKKQKAELERSLVVAKVKAAHKQIEETEKLRKRPIALSICKRIDSFLRISAPLMEAFSKPQFKNFQMTEGAVSTTKGLEKTFLSIRYDFQKNLDIGDEGMAKMFPMIEVRKDSIDHVSSDLIEVYTQMTQMRSFCERLLV